MSIGCEIGYAKIGCYNDDQNNPRPLPEQIFNDQKPGTPQFSGKFVDYDHWDTYMPQMVCRCARQTVRRGYKVFGIQFFGKCIWQLLFLVASERKIN